DLDEVLDRILRGVAHAIPVPHAAAISLVDEGTFRIVKWHGYAVGVMEGVKAGLSKPVESIPSLYWVMTHRSPLLIEDTRAYDDWVVIEGFEWIRAHACAPISVEGQVIGFLTLDSSTPGAFMAEHIARLQLFTNQAGVAILNVRLFEAERRQRQITAALYEIGMLLNSTRSLDDILEGLLVFVRFIETYDAANVMFLEGNQARVMRTFGYDHPDRLDPVGLTFALDATPNLARVVETRKGVTVPDVSAYPGWLAVPGTEWVQSWVGIPILARDDRLLGILSLDSAQAGTYQESIKDVLLSVANTAALAIDNARLFAVERRRREIANSLYEMSILLNSTLSLDETLYQLLVHVRQVAPADAVNVMFIEGEQARVMRALGYSTSDRPDPHGIFYQLADLRNLQQVIAERRMVSIPDVVAYPGWQVLAGSEWLRAWVGIPIITRDDRLAGILALDSSNPHAFDDIDEDILVSFANVAAIAIENARLFEAERHQRQVADTLREIGLVLTSALDQDVILERILEQLARVLPYDASSIWLTDGQGNSRLHLGVGYEQFGVAERICNLAFSPGTDPVAARLYHSTGTVIIPDVRQDPEWETLEGFEWIRSWAAATIVEQGKIIGKLVLEHAQPGFYGPQHATILNALSTQVSIAIENAGLFRTTQRYLDQMIALRHISLELAASQQDFDTILDVIIERFGTLLGADATEIWLWRADSSLLEQIATSGTLPGDEPGGRFLAWSEGLIGRSLARQEVMWSDSQLQSPVEGEPAADVSPYATVSVPMWWRGQPVGALVAMSDDPGNHLGYHDVRLLQLFAAHVAPTIVNAQLYDAVQRYASSLQELVNERTVELESERAQLQAILDGMGEGVIYTEDERICYVNRALARMVLPEGEDLPDTSALLSADYFQENVGRFMEDAPTIIAYLLAGRTWRAEAKVRRPDGAQIDVSFTTAMVSALSERPIRAVTLVRDISREKALQAQKDRFIAHASHELRTPLTNISTRLYLAHRQPERIDEHLSVIEYVTGRMSALVQDLLDVSRFERGVILLHQEDVVLQDLIEMVIRVQQPEGVRHGVDVVRDLPPAPLHVWADADRITQVVTNLLFNAISYTPAGGEVTVRVTLVEQGRVLVAVQDNGIGIAPDALPHIFEPFFRASEGNVTGTGLGLTIAQEIVEAHGSHIAVESVPGEGSTFSFSLMLVD
ncbi:MAG: GAF domain-containing protein, partial [Anaerolineae bacterium]|nr:GAF domain-containing protein [Anaerolineae bacterium]